MRIFMIIIRPVREEDYAAIGEMNRLARFIPNLSMVRRRMESWWDTFCSAP
jgi:hypothetical protein